MLKRIMVLGAVALFAVAGLAACGEMTPLQKQAVELRRFCEANPHAVERCVGFLGDL